MVSKKLELAKLKRLVNSQLRDCLSHEDPTSRPTPKQQEFFNDIEHFRIRWVVASNRSGKSASCARELAWLFTDSHPFFKRPSEWNGPLLFIILGKKAEQMETALWNGKIKPLLNGARVKEVRTGNMLQKVINLDNNYTILFQSHNNAEEARKNIQAYAAHYIFLDEMPESHRLVSELIMRITTTNGRLVGAFTPLVFNQNIRTIIDNAQAPIAKRYQFSIYDNPSIKGNIDEVIESIKQGCATEMEFRCRVYGEWMSAGQQVSAYNSEKHYVDTPPNYSFLWRHIVAVDPAASGLVGLTAWGECPTTGTWYCILSKYLKGEAAFELVQKVEAECSQLNVVRRVADPNPAGFYQEAARIGINYILVDKSRRKLLLIDGANKLLLTGKAMLTKWSSELEDELVSAAWNDKVEGRIINHSQYHCFDSMQYALDNLPTFVVNSNVNRTFDQEIKHQWDKARAAKSESTKKAKERYEHRILATVNRRFAMAKRRHARM